MTNVGGNDGQWDYMLEIIGMDGRGYYQIEGITDVLEAGVGSEEVDFTILKELCGIHCTGEECASVLGIDYDTLNVRVKEEYGYCFSDYYKKNSGEGKG